MSLVLVTENICILRYLGVLNWLNRSRLTIMFTRYLVLQEALITFAPWNAYIN